MSKAVEIIKSFLKNPDIKKILIAEDHFDYTPKETLIELFDEIVEGVFSCHKKLVLVLEHISIKDQVKIDEGVKKKEFSSELEEVFKKCPFIEPKNLEINMYSELAKKAIISGVPIIATENQATGYSSMISSTCINRVRTANPVFEAVFEDEIFSQEDVVGIFLGGAAHVIDMHPNSQLQYTPQSIMGLKSALNEQGDTVSIFIYDEGGNHLNKNPHNKLPNIDLEEFYGSPNFDTTLCVKPAKKLLLTQKDGAQASKYSIARDENQPPNLPFSW
ncbi:MULTISPECIES: hypothetical protein [Legionella]|uniref:Uncharacterized protein n=1 Tax=Legionella maceachernii TaxID=466 RepID=A0A0W0WGE9_9GAMM|nr:hypothetical protein [Legionella maceachernii]KTD31421.1 hypothetical protein Lmac_0296 [Legionella maceachernii]SKA23121.1 hypothetical protein SAMN02745128_02691 [Legionella maceachernii]SUO98690.1 Uncharacterised protein [Legionella maceachernii]